MQMENLREKKENLRERMENLREEMKNVMCDGLEDQVVITRLYLFIRKDPGFFFALDEQPFANTPLHFAAIEGCTTLALEILRQMPSFGKKLNLDGYTPVYLALKYGHTATATAMVSMNPQLAGVCSREGMTPLHYAATDEREEYVNALADFLYYCPDSIKVFTNKNESAMHIAVKSKNLMAFKVLLGWVKRTGEREVLRWRDCEGNTAMHLAAYTTQAEVINMLKEEQWCVDDKNLKGETAKDIVIGLPKSVDKTSSSDALRKCYIPKLSNFKMELPWIMTEDTTKHFARYLSSPMTINEWVSMTITYLSRKMSNDTRNAILVVAVLIATATFTAVLSAPGGFIEINESNKMNNGSAPAPGEGGGKVNMPRDAYVNFIWLNSIGLATSLATILLALPAHWANLLLYASMALMATSYTVAVGATAPYKEDIINFASIAPYILIAVVVTAKLLVLENRIMLIFETRMGIRRSCTVEQEKALNFHSKFMSIDLKQI